MSKVYLLRLLEELAVAFVAGAVPVLAASPSDFSKSALFGAMVAGLRGVYGVIIKAVGDPERPSVK